MATKTEELHDQLHRLHYISAAVFAALAVAAGLFMQPTTYPLVVGHLTKNELVSQTTTVFAPAIHTVMDIQLRWIVVITMAIAALFSLFTMTRWHERYHQDLKNEVQPLRWLNQGITGGLMIGVAGLVAGIQDVVTLKIMGLLVLLGAGLRWYSEKQHKESRNPVLTTFIISIIVDILPWLFIITSLIATFIWGAVRQPWYAYALYGVVGTGCIMLAFNHFKYLRRYGAWKNYMVVERNYLAINFVFKTAFALVLVIGLKK
jgi:hypothetical protein